MTAPELVKKLRAYLSTLEEETRLGNWQYKRSTNKAFSTRGGKWDGDKDAGYLFEKEHYRYLFRPITDDDGLRTYIAVGADHRKSQLANLKLEARNYSIENGQVSIYDNYKATVSTKRRSERAILEAMHEAGWPEQTPIYQFEEGKPQFDQLIPQFLEWAVIRERAKDIIKEQDSKISLAPSPSAAPPSKSVDEQAIPLNQIFFGPPGTGKTYHSINKALEIIAPKEGLQLANKKRSELRALFEQKKEEGQIVFTTFHQSLSYEDFIEGIKPLENEGAISYAVKPGIFRMLCNKAYSNFRQAQMPHSTQLPFEEAFEQLQLEWANDPEMKFPLKTPNHDYTITEFTPTSIRFKNSSGGTSHSLSINTLEELYNGKERDFRQGVAIYYPSILDKLKTYKSSQSSKPTPKNYVLIIDEINRGNVAQIFGELITLLEEDKRLTKEEALETTLPYSRLRFGVPPNLYIIGTMNTADRSVEALDAALRRRFSFEEMPPRPELVSPRRMVWALWWKHWDIHWKKDPYKAEETQLYAFLGLEKNQRLDIQTWESMSELPQEKDLQLFEQYKFEGINLERLLSTINKRIERLLDRDHLIGHSYFMSVNNLQDLKGVFQHKVIPLLQEYFFGDFGKIALVLGDDFCNRQPDAPNDFFAKAKAYDHSIFLAKSVYHLPDVTKMSDDGFRKAIHNLLYPGEMS